MKTFSALLISLFCVNAFSMQANTFVPEQCSELSAVCVGGMVGLEGQKVMLKLADNQNVVFHVLTVDEQANGYEVLQMVEIGRVVEGQFQQKISKNFSTVQFESWSNGNAIQKFTGVYQNQAVDAEHFHWMK